MRSPAFLCLAGAACLCAQVRYTPEDATITIDGQPFTTFHSGADAGKPFLAPLRSASGKIVTRRFPMESVPGESRDHLHHRGLWFSYDDVNGVKFWENDPSYTKPRMGRIAVRSTRWKQGDRTGTLSATMEWRAPDGKVLLLEDRDMTFYSDPKLRTIDFEIVLTSAEEVTLGDTKEGAFAIRLAENFTERKGCRIVDADGRTTMAKIWGKRSNWVDYSAEVDGERLGVAIFDHPQNPRHPTYWHARDYGLFALNPFGRHAFDPSQEESRWALPAGQKLAFRWRVVIHPGDAETGRVAELYRQYAAVTAALPELRIEPTTGGSVFYLKNVSPQPLTAFLIELVDYPGSSFSLLQDEAAADLIAPGGEKRIPVSNMTVGAVPDYVKVRAAIFADGSSAGLPEKVAQVLQRRRTTLATTRELIRRLEGGQSGADLKQWAESLPMASRPFVNFIAGQLGSQSRQEVLAHLRASERTLAASKPAL